MDFRVERLHPAVEKLGGPGEFGNIDNWQACIAQGLGSATGGEELDPEVVQFLGKNGESGFVGHGEKGAGDGHGWRLSRYWFPFGGADRQGRRKQAGGGRQAE